MATPAPLSDTAVAAALAAWRLPEPVMLRRIPGGYSSEAWLVTTPTGQFVAKYTYDGQLAVERGLRGAEILAAHGFPAAAPLRTSTGDLIVPVVGSHGRSQPLALLPFVSGVDLPPADPDVPELIGRDLGRLHAILLAHYPPPGERAGLLRYVSERTPEVAAHPGLQVLIDRALQQLQAFEVQTPATYGWAYGDWFGILRNPANGTHGWIDWGTLDWAPLLIDLVSAIEMVGIAAPERIRRMLDAYLAEAPISAVELRGLDVYAALLLARGAKYFAWRLAHGVTLGSDDPDENAVSLVEARGELKKLLDGRRHMLPEPYTTTS